MIIIYKRMRMLLDIGVTEESPGYWKVDNWSLSDLSKLVRLMNLTLAKLI